MSSASGGRTEGSLEVLVLAPLARDAEVLRQALLDANIPSTICSDAAKLVVGVRAGAGAVLLTEEALTSQAVAELASALESQPPWSDLPVIVLASRERLRPAGSQAIATLRRVGNLILHERPARALAIATSLHSALRGRQRQYDTRDLVTLEHAARVAAEEANRVKDEFLAMVSHELRTPLSAIMMFAGVIRSGRMNAQDVPSALTSIERSAAAQAHLIDDLLDAARMASGRLDLDARETEIETAVWAALEVVRPIAAAKGVRIDATVDSGGAVLLADPDRVQQIVWNLLSNAVKFTGQGGAVVLRLRRAADQVEIEVSDTGKGIDLAFLPHVFERFRQEHSSKGRGPGGLGLGLAIAKELVELHGGTISAESGGEGKGAAFTVRLPVLRSGAPGGEDGHEPSGAAAAS